MRVQLLTCASHQHCITSALQQTNTVGKHTTWELVVALQTSAQAGMGNVLWWGEQWDANCCVNLLVKLAV